MQHAADSQSERERPDEDDAYPLCAEAFTLMMLQQKFVIVTLMASSSLSLPWISVWCLLLCCSVAERESPSDDDL
jgi:hypothetical protein